MVNEYMNFFMLWEQAKGLQQVAVVPQQHWYVTAAAQTAGEQRGILGRPCKAAGIQAGGSKAVAASGPLTKDCELFFLK